MIGNVFAKLLIFNHFYGVRIYFFGQAPRTRDAKMRQYTVTQHGGREVLLHVAVYVSMFDLYCRILINVGTC